MRARLCIVLLCAATALAAPKRLFAITNGTLSTIDLRSGQATPFQGAWTDLSVLMAATSDPNSGYYILHGYFTDTTQAVQWFDIRTGEVKKTVLLEDTLAHVTYDAKLNKLIGLGFDGVMEIDQETGKFRPVFAFDPPFPRIDQLAEQTLDPLTHRYFFMNGSDGRAAQVLSIVDIAARKLVDNVLVISDKEQNFGHMMYDYITSSLVGFTEHAFWSLDLKTGELINVMDTPFVPFGRSTALDAESRLLSFIGTDGKERCFIITIDISAKPWRIIYQPQTISHITFLPEAPVFI